MARLSFRCDEDLVRRVDEARGMIPREAFMRAITEQALAGDGIAWIGSRAVEQALGEQATSVENPAREGVPGASGVAGPAPAEQPHDEIRWRPDSPEERLLGLRSRSSSQAKRDVRPIPKKGKS